MITWPSCSVTICRPRSVQARVRLSPLGPARFSYTVSLPPLTSSGSWVPAHRLAWRLWFPIYQDVKNQCHIINAWCYPVKWLVCKTIMLFALICWQFCTFMKGLPLYGSSFWTYIVENSSRAHRHCMVYLFSCKHKFVLCIFIVI